MTEMSTRVLTASWESLSHSSLDFAFHIYHVELMSCFRTQPHKEQRVQNVCYPSQRQTFHKDALSECLLEEASAKQIIWRGAGIAQGRIPPCMSVVICAQGIFSAEGLEQGKHVLFACCDPVNKPDLRHRLGYRSETCVISASAASSFPNSQPRAAVVWGGKNWGGLRAELSQRENKHVPGTALGVWGPCWWSGRKKTHLWAWWREIKELGTGLGEEVVWPRSWFDFVGEPKITRSGSRPLLSRLNQGEIPCSLLNLELIRLFSHKAKKIILVQQAIHVPIENIAQTQQFLLVFCILKFV